MRKKKLKAEIRRLAAGQRDLEDALRGLARHAEVVALAVRAPDRIPEDDLEAAISGIHELSGYADERT